VCMRTPDGVDLYNTWAYREIVPLERLEFVMGFADQDGQPVDPVALGLPAELARGVRHVVTFKPLGDKRTEMTVTEFGYSSEQVLDLSKAGLEQCLDKMAVSLAEG